jgi:hypothetical protein
LISREHEDRSLDQLDVITARVYGEHGYPHDAWTRMRREDTVHRCERPEYGLTKLANACQIPRINGHRFEGGPAPRDGRVHA